MPGALLVRKGAIWREFAIVPQPRLQSVSVRQGPILRMLRLAAVDLHTVAGPIYADLGAIDRGFGAWLLLGCCDRRGAGSEKRHVASVALGGDAP